MGALASNDVALAAVPAGAGAPSRPSRLGRLRAGIVELASARELTANLVRRDLKVRHRGTFLGMLWSLATPLLIVALYWFIFSFIVAASPATDVARPDGAAVPFAVYFFGGLVVWNLFANAISASTGSVVGAGYLLNKVYFPRAILPLSAVLSGLVTFGFELVVLLAMTLVLVGLPSIHLLWLPVIVAVVLVLAFGMALLLSALTVFLRDVAHFIGLAVQIWFWGTPIIYSLGYVAKHPGFVRLLELNPMTGVVVSFRNVVLLNHGPNLALLGYSALVALAMLALGTAVFARWQAMFSEIV